MRTLLVMAALAASIPSAYADDASVAVQTQRAQRGTVPALVTAYGTAAPALNGGMTLSLQQEGRVISIAVTPGEAAQTGDRLMEFGVSAAASSSYNQAVTALALAKTQRTHFAQLLAQQLATRDQLAQADKALQDAQAALDALRREGGGKPVQTLTAPFDGIVGSIAVAPGDRLQPGAPLMVVTRLDGLVVTVGLDPTERRRVQTGAPVTLQRLSGGPMLDGHVLRVDAVINPKTRLVDADIAVPPGSVLSGEAFRATVTTGQVQGWMVPHDAVFTDAKGAFLFQVSSASAARVDVTVAGATGDTDVVQGPLNAARPIIIQGGPQLSDGAAIRMAQPTP